MDPSRRLFLKTGVAAALPLAAAPAAALPAAAASVAAPLASAAPGPLLGAIISRGYNPEKILTAMLQGYEPAEMIEDIGYIIRQREKLEVDIASGSIDLSDPDTLAHRLILCMGKSPYEPYNHLPIGEFLSRDRQLVTEIRNPPSSEEILPNPMQLLGKMVALKDGNYFNDARQVLAQVLPSTSIGDTYATLEASDLARLQPFFEKAYRDNPEALAQAIATQFQHWDMEKFMPVINRLLPSVKALPGTNGTPQDDVASWRRTLSKAHKGRQGSQKTPVFNAYALSELSTDTHHAYLVIAKTPSSASLLKTCLTRDLGSDVTEWKSESVCMIPKDSVAAINIRTMAANHKRTIPATQVTSAQKDGICAQSIGGMLSFGG